MWEILLRVLLQSNKHCREKHGWNITLQKFKLGQWLPNISYLHTPNVAFKEKIRIRDGQLTNITNKQAKNNNAHHPIDTVLKCVKA